MGYGMNLSVAKILLLLGGVLFVSSCGKMGPPVAPEMLAPEQVQALKVSGSQEGVTFSWESPKADQRGQALKTIDGYRIYRKHIQRSSDVTDESIAFDVVTEVKDTHLIELEKERENFRALGRPAHRAKVDKAFTLFNYTDRAVNAGNTYLYKVVPTNHGGVESSSFQLVKVLWRGDSSEIKNIDSSKLSVDAEFLGADLE